MNKEVAVLIVMVLTVLIIAVFYGLGSDIVSRANQSVTGEDGLINQKDQVSIQGSFSKSHILKSDFAESIIFGLN